MADQTAVFRAVADFNKVVSEANRTTAALAGTEAAANRTFGKRFQSSLRSVEGGLMRTGRTWTTHVTLPVVAAGAAAIHTFADFDASITKAGQKAGASTKQMRQMRDVALDWGKKSTFSARESAEAMDELAALGLNAKQTMKALPGVISAAQASQSDLAETAKIVGQSMKAFNLPASKSVHIADVLSSASNESAIDMHGLGAAMAQAGQLGATANQKFEDVVAGVSRLVDLGVPAASAGAAIRQGMQSLQAPRTADARKAIDKLGLSVRDAEGNMLPLPEIAKRLQEALDGSNPAMKRWQKQMGMNNKEMRDYALASIFGVEGGKAFGLMIGNTKPLTIAADETQKMKRLQEGLAKTMGKKGAQAWIKARTEQGKFTAKGADVIKAMAAMGRGSDGLSKKMVGVFSKTASAQLEQIQGGLETVAIQLVQAMLPAILMVSHALIKMLDWLSDAMEAHQGLTKIAIAFAAVAAAVGPIAFALVPVVKGIRLLTAATSGSIAGMKRMASWVGQVAGGSNRTGRMLDGLRLRMMQVTAATKAGLSTAKAWVVTQARAAKAAVASAVAAARQKAALVAQTVATRVAAAATKAWVVVQRLLNVAMKANVLGVVITLIAALVAGLIYAYKHSSTFRRIVNATWKGIKKVVGAVVGWFLKHVVPFFTKTLPRAFKRVLGWVRKNWPILLSLLGGPIALFLALVVKYRKRIFAWFRSLWAWVRKTFRKLWNGVKHILSGPIDAARRVIGNQVGKIRTGFRMIWQWVKSTFRKWWNGVKGVFADPVRSGWVQIRKWLGLMKSGFKIIWNWVRSTFRKWWNGIQQIFTNPIQAAKNVFSRLLGKGGPFRSIFQSAVKAIRSILNGLRAAAAKPVNFVLKYVYNKGIRWAINKIPGVKDLPEAKPLKFGSGGSIPGGGANPTADDVPIWATAREFMVRRRSADRMRRRHPGAMEFINRHGDLPGYAKGGTVKRVWPVPGHLTGTYPGHDGVDINRGSGWTDYGDPIRAAAAGNISYAGSGRGYGNAVFIRGPYGEVVYGHMSKILRRSGEVQAGDLIGRVGSTGNSSSPHLHFGFPGGTTAQALAFLRGAKVFGGMSASASGQVTKQGFLSSLSAGFNKLKQLPEKFGEWGTLLKQSFGSIWSKVKGWGLDKIKSMLPFMGSSGVSGPRISGGGTAAQNMALGKRAAAEDPYNWTGVYWDALRRLWIKESGWRTTAENPSSGAYGIPQALPGSKMASAGADWRTNAGTQIRWGLDYIRDRYGTPLNAWMHSQRTNWYAGGTRSAERGLAVVGEDGPEVLQLRGGEQITPWQDLVSGHEATRTRVPLRRLVAGVAGGDESVGRLVVDQRSYTWNVHNPVPEKTSKSTLKTLTRHAHGED